MSDLSLVGHVGDGDKAEDYLGPQAGFFGRLRVMRNFLFRVGFQSLPFYDDEGARGELMEAGFSIMNELLTQSGFHYHHRLDAKSSEGGLSYIFDHPTRHFQVRVDNEAFEIKRAASSMRHFVDWYLAMMGGATRVYSSFQKELQEITGYRINPTSTRFVFEFWLTGFRRAGEQTARRNVEVLQSLLPEFPAPDGTSKSLTDQDFFRVDLQVSRQIVVAGKRRNGWYSLEAPFDDDGRDLAVTLELRGTSQPELNGGAVGEVKGFDDDALNDHAIALKEFLRDHAANEFLATVLKDWEFEAVMGSGVGEGT